MNGVIFVKNKKILAGVFLLTVICMLSTQLCFADNFTLLTVNFDGMTSVDGNLFAAGGSGNGGLAIDDTVYRGASGKSLRFSGRDDFGKRVRFENALIGSAFTEGDIIEFSMWVKIGGSYPDIIPGSEPKLMIGVFTQPGGNVYVPGGYNHQPVIPTRDWTQIKFSYVVPADTTNYSFAVSQVANPVMDTIYFDDFTITKKTSYLFDDVRTGNDGFYNFAKQNLGIIAAGGLDSTNATIYPATIANRPGSPGAGIVVNRVSCTNRPIFSKAFSAFTMEEGKVFDISAWVKVGDQSTADSGTLYFVSTVSGTDQVELTQSSVVATKSGWVQLKMEYTVPAVIPTGIGIRQAWTAIPGEPSTEDLSAVITQFYIDDLIIAEHTEPFDVSVSFKLGASTITSFGQAVGESTLNAAATVSNYENEEFLSAVLLLVIYDNEDKIKAVNISNPQSLSGSVPVTLTADVTGTTILSTDTVKAFVWENTNSIKPLDEAFPLPKN